MKCRMLALALFVFFGPEFAHAATAVVSSTDPIAATDAGALFGSAKVTIPWGAYVSGILNWAQEIVVTIAVTSIAYLSRSLPAWGVSLIQEYVTQKRIERAVNYGITQVQAKIGDQTIDVPAANDLIAMAEQYMLKMAPQTAESLGDRLKPMILAQVAKIGAAPAAPIPSLLPVVPVPQLRK